MLSEFVYRKENRSKAYRKKGKRIKKYTEANFRGFPGLVYQNTHQKSGPYRHMRTNCQNISKPTVDIGYLP
jgi:hypothetical protein